MADGAAGADSILRTPDLGKEFAAAIDDIWVIIEIGCRIDHAQGTGEGLLHGVGLSIGAQGKAKFSVVGRIAGGHVLANL